MGFFITLFRFGDSASFLCVYAIMAYFFSHKMVRLVLLTAPIASSLGGIAVGRIVAWSVSVLVGEDAEEDQKDAKKSEKKKSDGKSKSDGKKKKDKKSVSSSSDGFAGLGAIKTGFIEASKSTEGRIVKTIAAIIMLGSLYMQASTFKNYSWKISASLSNPSIILKGQTREGNVIKVDDYREAYWWLRDNTPEDARIMVSYFRKTVLPITCVTFKSLSLIPTTPFCLTPLGLVGLWIPNHWHCQPHHHC